MLVGVGKLPVAKLLDSFQLMAQNKNEKHEHWGDPNYVHGDGWGIVVKSLGKLECYKKDTACWKDPIFAEFCKVNTDFIMLHARKASRKKWSGYEFTHPFDEDGWYFCHNGTIYNHDFRTEGKSDAQQLFTRILHNMKTCKDAIEAIRTTVSPIREYSALNFILAKEDQVYVLNMYGKDGEKTPNYYTMRYLQREEYTLVSSETLENFGNDWEKMKNRTLLKLNIRDRGIQFFNI
jgi:predicted glutamine amidotransferase